jgi:sugar O-acyltransferase (sialic acid O-acetyltransferase NeuD family)
MKRIVIIGAGGHGREVAEVVLHQARTGGEVELLGFVDDRQELHGRAVDGLPVLGGWSWFEGVDRGEVAVICAVGSPQVCRRLVARARDLGLAFADAISPLAYVSAWAQLGQGVAVFPNVFVSSGACVGDHCILNVAATVSHDTRIGRYSNINPGAHLAGGVTVGEGCYVGMGAKVIQGISIGDWTIIGAGGVVIDGLPSNVTAVGVPAGIIKAREEGWHER